jgi:hypothetical protein
VSKTPKNAVQVLELNISPSDAHASATSFVQAVFMKFFTKLHNDLGCDFASEFLQHSCAAMLVELANHNEAESIVEISDLLKQIQASTVRSEVTIDEHLSVSTIQ